MTRSVWRQRAEIEQMCIDRAVLNRKISFRDFKPVTVGDQELDNAQQWTDSTRAIELFEAMKAHELQRDLCLKQENKLRTVGDEGKAKRQVFLKLFATSSFGLGLNWGAGKRLPDMQSTFRAELIKQSNAQNPDPKRRGLWCPITAEYLTPESITAAHIFPYKHGQDLMDAIFGIQDSPELFSPKNGILISKSAEEKIDKGQIVIVPDVPNANGDWQTTSPKEYKIKILAKDAPGMECYISENSTSTWVELDGRRLQFKSDLRPRGRYLYFLYCSTILRRSWTVQRAGEILKDELGRPFWGTVGRYVKKSQLLGFIEHMGHEYDDLLMGAIEDGGEEVVEPDPTALATASERVLDSINKRTNMDGDTDVDDDFEEEEDTNTENDSY